MLHYAKWSGNLPKICAVIHGNLPKICPVICGNLPKIWAVIYGNLSTVIYDNLSTVIFAKYLHSHIWQFAKYLLRDLWRFASGKTPLNIPYLHSPDNYTRIDNNTDWLAPYIVFSVGWCSAGCLREVPFWTSFTGSWVQDALSIQLIAQFRANTGHLGGRTPSKKWAGKCLFFSVCHFTFRYFLSWYCLLVWFEQCA